MSQKPIPADEQKTKHLVPPPVQFQNTQYVVLHDGTVARLLKPRTKGNVRYWSLNIDGRLQVMSQKTIDEVIGK